MWKYIKEELPPEGVVLECTTSSGGVVELKRRGKLYFAGDVYVYYVPVMWRIKN